jgi:hypothetical protein
MATKKQIAEQAMRILAGGHLKPDRNLDIREVMLNLDQIRDRMVRLSTYSNIKEGDYSVDEDWLSFYESVAVSTDATKGLKYITLPANAISLPRGLGVYQITPIADMEDAFIIIQPGQVGMLSGTDALEHELKTYCWPVGERVYFKNLDVSISVVTVLMASSSKDIAESSSYPIPPDMEAELLEQLIKVFSILDQQPHDELEDGQK